MPLPPSIPLSRLLLGLALTLPLGAADAVPGDKPGKRAEAWSDSVPPKPPASFISFEQDANLAPWQVVQGGAVDLSREHAKDGQQALRWAYVPGSRLRLRGFQAFARVAEPHRGRLKCWIYNPTPSAEPLHLRIGTESELAAGDARYTCTFGLDFTGWRTLWLCRPDRWAGNPGYHGTGIPDTLELQAPAGGSRGVLFLDNLEADQESEFKISTDRQMPFIDQGENSREWRIANFTPPPGSLPPITAAQQAECAAIAQRVDRFLFPDGVDYARLPPTDPLRIRYDSLQKTIAEKIPAFDQMGIGRRKDGKIHGPGLYASGDAKKPKYADFEKTWIALLADWKLNGTADSRRRLMDLLAHFHDQGYADGSSAGYTGIEHIRMDGWAFAAYGMRHELAAAGQLEDTIATMKWKTLFGLVYRYDPRDLSYSFETDYIRGTLLFQLLAVLMMPDSDQKARDLRCFTAFVDQVIAPKSGLRGGMKPDFIVFHHNNAYLGAYGLEALNVLGEIAWFLDGTSFALSAESRETLRKALVAYRDASNGYHLHLGLYGRMPETVDPLLGLIGPYAYFGLTGDRDLAASFLALWNPQDPRVQAVYPRAMNSINYFTTLGQMTTLQEATRKFRSDGVTAAAPTQGCQVYPYGSFAVHRRNDWMVTTRGFSPQAMNYEYGIDGYDQNPWGKYVNYGTTLVYYPSGNAGSGVDTAHGWDWNRWPGSTAINLPLDELKYATHHCYGSDAFVGGVTHDGRHGVFAMSLREPEVADGLRARKSWFYFGDEVVCLGSDIRAADPAHPVETTLFQYATGEAVHPPCWVNGPQPITADSYQREFTTDTAVWLVDPAGTGYVIPHAQGLSIHRGERTSVTHLGAPSIGDTSTAWLDHGAAPDGQRYEYTILPAAQPADVERRMRTPDYTVLRQDASAHIVRSQTLGAIGYALFAPGRDLAHGRLAATSAPVLAMETTTGPHRIRLNVADPDLRMGRTARYVSREATPAEVIPSAMQPVRLTLRGAWRSVGPLAVGTRLIASDPGAATTTWEIDAVDGKTFTSEWEEIPADPAKRP